MTISEKTDSNKGIPEGKKREWKSCGYISKTKNPKVLLVMLKHQRFIVNVNGIQDVLNGKVEYTEICERIEGDKALQY